MYRKEAFITLDSLLARGRTRSTHVTEERVRGSPSVSSPAVKKRRKRESVSASARVRERRENIQRERGVGADARAAVPSDKCLDCQSGATSRPPRREDHACGRSDSSSIVWSSLGTAAAGGQPTPRGERWNSDGKETPLRVFTGLQLSEPRLLYLRSLQGDTIFQGIMAL